MPLAVLSIAPRLRGAMLSRRHASRREVGSGQNPSPLIYVRALALRLAADVLVVGPPVDARPVGEQLGALVLVAVQSGVPVSEAEAAEGVLGNHYNSRSTTNRHNTLRRYM